MSREHQLSILLVDRDASGTSELKRILSDDGFHVEVLNEPERAPEDVAAARAQEPVVERGNKPPTPTFFGLRPPTPSGRRCRACARGRRR